MSDRAKELVRNWRAHLRSSAGKEGRGDPVLGLAGSFTIDPLLPYLGATLLGDGLSPALHNANYNQVLKVCRNHEGEFGNRALDALVLLWRIEDLADPSEPASVRAACESFLVGLAQLRERFPGAILVGMPPRPRPFVDGIATFSRASDLTVIWYEMLQRAAEISRTLPNLYTFDVEAAITACGAPVALDHRKELLYRQPYSEQLYLEIAGAIARVLRARRLEPKKCIVVDCDNTLWGGVIGEDGVGGVELSDDLPGAGFRHFQRQLKALSESGVLLALNSKNNPDDVWEMFETHDGMVLRRADVSAARINWRPKSENLKEIAKDLNIGLDSLVFIDDSPFEIEEVRTHAPEVTCLQVPEDVADLPVLMRDASRLFDRLEVTADDRARVAMMRQELGRRDLAQRMTEDEFLASLGLEVMLFRPGEADLARVAQLINKTNQFNVTTKRYSLEEVRAMASDPSIELLAATVKDRFGEYGLVGVSIARRLGTAAELDTFLMSCRVLGRGIETAMLSEAVSRAHAESCTEVRGRYVPTRKNAMVADLFARHGFLETVPAGEGEGTTDWVRDTSSIPVPAYLAVHVSRPA